MDRDACQWTRRQPLGRSCHRAKVIVDCRSKITLEDRLAGVVFWSRDQSCCVRICLRCGRAAAEAILGSPSDAAENYRSRLAVEHLPFHRIAAAVHAGLVGRPLATAAVARLLAVAGSSDALSGGWAVFWNELLDGAPLNRHRSVANAVTQIGRVMTARGATARWFNAELC